MISIGIFTPEGSDMRFLEENDHFSIIDHVTNETYTIRYVDNGVVEITQAGKFCLQAIVPFSYHIRKFGIDLVCQR